MAETDDAFLYAGFVVYFSHLNKTLLHWGVPLRHSIFIQQEKFFIGETAFSKRRRFFENKAIYISDIS
jgi:hypothetical protein